MITRWTKHRRRPCFLGLLVAVLGVQRASASFSINNPNLDQVAVVDPSIPGHPTISQEFTLKHVYHHVKDKKGVSYRRFDIKPEATVMIADKDGSKRALQPLRARARPMKIQRLANRKPETIEPLLAASRSFPQINAFASSAWTNDDVLGPDPTDKETVITVANVAADAYVQEPGTGNWEDPAHGYNESQEFGWHSDHLRGHIFADATNSTIIMGIKGTTPAVFDGAETTTNDKVNDNLFFGCCCGQGGQWLWRAVCDCQSTTYTCNQTCLVKELRAENRYYRAALDLYSNVTELYPNSTIWLAGHSLGGAVSSLLALTYGLPVFTFEAPGEALAASRLNLPSPPGADPSKPQTWGFTGGHHFGQTADPVFMGACNGATSACSLGGYAMETACHTGFECVYDTVKDLGWRVGIGSHSIRNVIDTVMKKYEKVPKCVAKPECVDCELWKFFKSNGSDVTSTKTSSTATTRTRTTTCKTPGWWGCLDESTTTTGTSTSTSTTTTSTSTCKTPGWFGCYDKTTTTSSSITTTTFTSSTAEPAPIITTVPRTTSVSSTTASTATSSVCETPGLFWGCWDPVQTKSATVRTRPQSGSLERLPRATMTPSAKQYL